MVSFKAGQRLTAATLNSALLQSAYKGSDQSVTSSTVLVNDTALLLPVTANTTYMAELLVFYTGGTAGSSDIKWDFTVPSGTVLSPIRELGLNTSLAVQYLTVPAGGAFGSNGSSNKLAFEVACTLVTSSTTGNLQFQWCQNTSSATATTVKAGSVLRMWQLLP